MHQQSKKTLKAAFIGNPNCGKTTLFNQLTGKQQCVGNWPGVTVERKSGHFSCLARDIEVIDLPGTYSLTVSTCGQDEQITRSFLDSNQVDLLINVVDASNLERHLYLTLQALCLGLPVVVVLNRMDVLAQMGQQLDLKGLEAFLGCCVVPMVATQNEGYEHLKKVISQTIFLPKMSLEKIFPASLLKQIYNLQANLPLLENQVARLLEGDGLVKCVGGEKAVLIESAKHAIRQEMGFEADVAFAKARYDSIDKCLRKIQKPLLTSAKHSLPLRHRMTEWLDWLFLNRLFGLPLFLMVMYLMFSFAINVGGVFQDFFDITSHAIFVEGVREGLLSLHAPSWLISVLSSGLGKGINTILTFIPVLGTMFLALAFLEDSGYMTRAAFVVDRFMRAIGLPGKSFVPMIVGFGCNVPAIMASRILESKQDRILTVLMSPFMSCGARLAIFTVFVSAFFPQKGGSIVFGLYFIGIVMAILTGLILKRTLLKGELAPLVLELPDYHVPQCRSLLVHTKNRLKQFLLNAGKLILPVCIVLGTLNSLSPKGQWLVQNEIETQQTQNSILAVAGQKITPIFHPMGITDDNWPATVSLFTGVMAKEVVVGTLNALYEQESGLQDQTVKRNMDDKKEYQEKQKNKLLSPRLGAAFIEGLISIKDNFQGLISKISSPLVGMAGEKIPSFSQSQSQERVYGVMVSHFDGQVGAFAYLLFVLLYVPCVSATMTMVREIEKRWTLFSVVWTTSLAYGVSVFFYQTATFFQHPLGSSIWAGVIVSSFLGAIYLFRHIGQRFTRHFPTPIVLSAG